jgi:hypothetical protein
MNIFADEDYQSENVYFVLQRHPNKRYVKIGRSDKGEQGVLNRLSHLQTSTPFELVLLGYLKNSDENFWHRHYSDFRIKREWFDLTFDYHIFRQLNLLIPQKILDNFKIENLNDKNLDNQEVIIKYKKYCFNCLWGIDDLDLPYYCQQSSQRVYTKSFEHNFEKAFEIKSSLCNIINNSKMFADDYFPLRFSNARKDTVDIYGFPITSGQLHLYAEMIGRFNHDPLRISLISAYKYFYEIVSKKWRDSLNFEKNGELNERF